MNVREQALLAGALLAFATIVLLFLGYLLLRLVMQRQGFAMILGFGMTLAAQYAVLQWLYYEKTHFSEMAGSPSGRILTYSLGMEMIFVILGIVFARAVRSWDQKHVTEDSVRKGLDELPVGMCYYWPGGLPKLVNEKLSEVAKLLYGEPIYDGRLFWNKLSDGILGVGGKALQAGEEPMYALSNGRVYAFRQREILIEGHTLYEILATDVTEEQRRAGELREKCEKADDISRRFRNLNQSIEKMTIEKEILATKTRIHNDFGEAQTMARQYLEHPEESLLEGVIRSWKRSLYLMTETEGRNTQLSETELSVEAAKEMGLSVRLLGELPDQEETSGLIAPAIRVCAANAVAYGKGTELTVEMTRIDGEFHVVIRNNGKLPEGSIQEGGGLGNLRRQVEQLGGSMRTGCKKFTLHGAQKVDGEDTEGLTAEEFFVEIILP